MDRNAAIEKLQEFKQVSSGIGKCDLVSLTEDSFVVKVQFGEMPKEDRVRVVGFCPAEKKTR